MLKTATLLLLLTCALLAGCQSARFLPALPRTSEYGAVRSQPLATQISTEPMLSAALPTGTPELSAAPTPISATRMRAEHAAAPPDTALNRLPRPNPVIPADPKTTVINAIGGVTAAAGIGAMISGDSNVPSWAPATGILVGLGLLVVGTTLLFFQGKNGRLRKMREARDREVAPTAAAARSRNFKKGLRKIGRILLITGGVLLLLGLLVPYGIYLAFLPALVLIVTGLFMVAFSN